MLPTLAGPSRSVVGVDLTHRTLQLARQVEAEGDVPLVQGVAESLPFVAGGFDAVVIRLALHHFADPPTVLEAARQVLRPGGRLVVLDVLGPEEVQTRALRDSIERIRDPSHTSVLCASSMRALLTQCHFELQEETLWSQERVFSEWAQIMNEPQRMADLERVLRALIRHGDDPTGLNLRPGGEDLAFTYDRGLFVATS
jgi:SAM-dependent methyltransferase